MKPIYYLATDDGSEPIEIGNDIEEIHPKLTPFVCIEGIDKILTPDDIEDDLKKGLEQGGTESNDDIAEVGLLRVYQCRKYGRAFVKFEKVWEATGCEIVLNGTKKLFGGSTIFVSRMLENDLPDNVKECEARDRIKTRAKKKAEAKKKEEEEEEAEE